MNAVISRNPYYTYAKMAAIFSKPSTSCHWNSSYCCDGIDCEIHQTASIGANCVIGNHVKIAANVVIGPGCVIGDDVDIGEELI